MASDETCIQINNIWDIGGRTMFYISKKVNDRVRVVMYGRIVYMTNEEYTRWKSIMAWDSNR